MIVDVQLPQWLARFNRHVSNPIQRLWAGWAPTMGILEHVGQALGQALPHPADRVPADDGVAALLTYGRNRDWLKNLTAAGEGRMQRYGRTFTVTDPHVMPKSEAAAAVKSWWRPIFSRLPFEDALLLKRW